MGKYLLINIIIILSVMFPCSMAYSLENYDVLKRFSLTEDKFLTHKMLSSDKDIFDLDIYLNKRLKNLVEKVKKIEEKQSPEKQLEFAQGILSEYDQTEQFVSTGLELNIPLPRFRIKSLEFDPLWEIRLQGASMAGIFKKEIDFADLLEYVGSEVPDFIKKKLLSCREPSPGQDIILNAIDNDCISRILVHSYLGKYFYPKDPSVPQVFNYTKIEARLGPRFRYNYSSKFSGDFKLYWLGRSDFKLRITDEAIRNNVKLVNFPKKFQNSRLALDHRLQYRNRNFFCVLSIEELKLMAIKEGQGSTALLYGDHPLLRWHTHYSHRLTSLFQLKTYLGTHYRKHYNPLEVFYVGIDLGIVKTRLESTLRFQVDQEHVAFAPRLKFYLISLEGLLKAPLKKQIDGIKIPTLWGLNFKIAI